MNGMFQVILEYNVIAGLAGNDFVNEVNAAIEQQWQPLGPAAVSTGGEQDWMYQTMVRYGWAKLANQPEKGRVLTQGGRR